ncbi:MAG: tetratricopeptide repeat protein [Candidatus Eisenbacteria bacterium]
MIDMGRVEESFEQSRIALALDPLNTAVTLHMGWHFLMAGQLDQAIAQYEATLRLDPSYSAAYTQMTQAYALSGRFDEAVTAWNKRLELPQAPDSLWMAAIIAARRGHTREATRMVSSMIVDAKRGDQSAYALATVLAQLSRKDEALQWLALAIKRRDAEVTSLKMDPFLSGLRGDPRFAALIRQVGLHP